MQQTHYDTLKVSRDAPIEVIRAAYRVLSLKYHPDRQPADSAAADTMGLLNKAYEVLSDPERRLAYDAWIRQIKAESSHVQRSKATTSRPARVHPDRGVGSDAALSERFALHLRQFGTLYGVAVLVLACVSLVVLFSLTHEPQMNGWMAVTPAPEDREAYIRQVARDLMLRRSEYARGSAAVPTAPETGALPSNNSPASATEREKPVRHAEAHSKGDAPQPSDTARSLMHLGEEAPSTPEPSALPQSNEDAADRATHSFESQLLGRDAVGGTE
jgi:hypothetical protein